MERSRKASKADWPGNLISIVEIATHRKNGVEVKAESSISAITELFGSLKTLMLTVESSR